MSAPIALQLYTVRDLLAKDYTGTVKQVAEIGYGAVETAGFPGSNAKDAAALFQSLGLTVASGHMPMPLGDKKNEVIETAALLGCKRIVSGRGPDEFKTLDKIKASCDLFNQASQAARANGLEFAIHNHWWEYVTVDGRLVYQVMLEQLDPAVLFELDVYWVKTGGCDPAAVLHELGKRAPLLHIKDGPCQQGKPMTAVGDGVVDFASIAKASEGTADWWIVELDSCATDMMEAVRKSYQFLTSKGLARGKK